MSSTKLPMIFQTADLSVETRVAAYKNDILGLCKPREVPDRIAKYIGRNVEASGWHAVWRSTPKSSGQLHPFDVVVEVSSFYVFLIKMAKIKLDRVQFNTALAFFFYTLSSSTVVVMKNVVELPVPYLFPCLEFVFNGTHRSIPSHTYSVKDIQCGLPLILSTISNFSFLVLTSSLIYFFCITNSGKISAQPHPILCIQFLNRENNDKNNTFPLGKHICFTIVWGCVETLPKFLGIHKSST